MLRKKRNGVRLIYAALAPTVPMVGYEKLGYEQLYFFVTLHIDV